MFCRHLNLERLLDILTDFAVGSFVVEDAALTRRYLLPTDQWVRVHTLTIILEYRAPAI